MDLDQLEKLNTTGTDTKCIKFLKRKFKCILIYMLFVISIIQLVILMFDKIEAKYINIILDKLISTNGTFWKTPECEWKKLEQKNEFQNF